MAPVLPPKPEVVLSTGERLWFWVAANRTKIGGVILSLSACVRVMMSFKAHSEVADTLKAISDLFIAGGAAALTAGATHGDEHYQAKKEETVMERSGSFPQYKGEVDARP